MNNLSENKTEKSVQIIFEKTPNPQTLKFNFPGNYLDNSIEFTTAHDAERSPLATKIFGFPWTESIYMGPNFMSITKQDWVEWDFIAQPLADLIAEHFELDLPLLAEFSEALDEDDNDSPVVKQIKRILDAEIRPAVAFDGGDVVFNKFEDGKLYVQFKGSCVGCPSKSVTLKSGIEVRIREVVPEVLEVIGL